MKTIREVCKLVGVTRRTLQEYDRIGLLSPANKDSRTSSNDAWLYSDKDIWKLIQIQMLIAAGMKRKDIRELLKDPEFKMEQTLLLATKRLKEEKSRLDLLKENLNEFAAVFPDSNFEDVDPEFLFLTHSFLEYLNSDALVFVRFTAADSPTE